MGENDTANPDRIKAVPDQPDDTATGNPTDGPANSQSDDIQPGPMTPQIHTDLKTGPDGFEITVHMALQGHHVEHTMLGSDVSPVLIMAARDTAAAIAGQNLASLITGQVIE